MTAAGGCSRSRSRFSLSHSSSPGFRAGCVRRFPARDCALLPSRPVRSRPRSWPAARWSPRWSASCRVRWTRGSCASSCAPAPQLEVGAPVVELDISESVLALEKVAEGPQGQGEPTGAVPADAREIAGGSRRANRGQDTRPPGCPVAARKQSAAVQGQPAVARSPAAVGACR